ncbi:MAG: fumarate hydratase, partial [Duodenibacillus sp.]|nr:fumarate hydratase [Duodenibacillus sp.]
LVPADGPEGVKRAVLEIVRQAGCNPCPPTVIGVGVGSSMDGAAVLSKRAICRPIDVRHPDPRYAQLELEILELVNKTGIGPQLGGSTTSIGVNIEHAPTHIGALPVAVTLCCHANRHKECTI